MALMVLKRTAWGDVVTDQPVLEPGALAVLDRIEALEVEAQAGIAHEREQARSEGYRAGLLEGRAQAVRDVVGWSRDLQAQAHALERYVVRAIDAALVSVFGELPREVALPAMIGRALGAVDPPGRLTLRVNPSDQGLAHAALDRAEAHRLQVGVVGDAGLPPGACRLESEGGCLDAGLEVQLAALREALVGPAANGSVPSDGDAASARSQA